MCGISGIFSFVPGLDASEQVKQMVRCHENRGPDESALFVGEDIILGHSRLSIIDVKKGQQPFISSDRRYVLVFNGEIFNYLELKKDLEKLGSSFRTESDTEVLIEGFRCFGSKFVNQLNGQFAFAIFDLKSRELFLARDRFGIRPLYFAFDGGRFIFSSTIKSILSTGVCGELDLEALNQAVHLWTTFGETTFVRAIQTLQPGFMGWVRRDGSLTKHQYWDLGFQRVLNHASEEDLFENVRTVLWDSVKRQSRSDVGVNTYLSGGVDSCILQSILHNQRSNSFKSYSVQFEDKYFDESGSQALLTDSTSVVNRNVKVSTEDIAQNFETSIWNIEQPVFRTAPVPMMMLSSMVRSDGGKVVISGEGADEIAWGYPLFKENHLRYQMLSSESEETWGDSVVELNSQLPQYHPRFKKFLLDFYRSSVTDLHDPLFTHEIRVRNGGTFGKYINGGILNREKLAADMAKLLPTEFYDWSVLQRSQYIEMKTLLANYLLSSQGDRMAMANSVEARVPFLDNDVVDLFCAVPDRLKLRSNSEDKFCLRQAYKDMLPPELCKRPKYPYRAPEGSAMLLEPLLSEYLHRAVIEDSGIFKWDFVSKLIEKAYKNIEPWNFTENNALVMITSTILFRRFLRSDFSKVGDQLLKFRVLREDQLNARHS